PQDPMNQAPTIWSRSLERLRNSTSDYVYKNWISQISELRFDGEELVLGVPNLFVRDWIQDHYQDVVMKAVQSAHGSAVNIVYEINKRQPRPEARPSPSAEAPPLASGVEIAEIDVAAPRPRLNERYTFDSFV